MGNEKCNLLVIDNSTAITSPWKNDLRERYNCVEAIGWFESVKKLQTNEFSAILINICNTKINGEEIIIKIREKNNSIPIVAITPNADTQKLNFFKQYGIHDFVVYPFDPLILIDKISLYALPAAVEIPAIDTISASAPAYKKPKPSDRNNGFTDVPTKYYEGQSSLLNAEYDKAISIFQSIANEKRLKLDTWLKFVEDSQFQIGRCLMKKNDYQKSIDAFTFFLQKAPRNDNVKQALFLIGENYEKLNECNKAINFYKKIISMGGFDSLITQARKRIKIIQNGS